MFMYKDIKKFYVLLILKIVCSVFFFFFKSFKSFSLILYFFFFKQHFSSLDTNSQESVESLAENSDSHTSQSDNGSHRNSTVTSSHSSVTNSSSCPTNAQVAAHLLSPSQVTLSNLPKLISQLAGTKGLPNLSELSPQEGKITA